MFHEIESQLRESDHPINIVIRIYVKSFLKQYYKYINVNKSNAKALRRRITKKNNVISEQF